MPLTRPRHDRRGSYLCALALIAMLALAACGSKKKSTTPPATPTRVTTAVAAQTVIPGVPIFTPGAPTPTRALTPARTPIPTTPTVPPTPTVRNEGGLQIEEVSFAAVVTESGGVRIRSAPQIDPNNVVGSLPRGAPVQVTGKVLNGAEAEQGLGTVWCIVGVKQYLYCGNGYISQNGASPTPAR